MSELRERRRFERLVRELKDEEVVLVDSEFEIQEGLTPFEVNSLEAILHEELFYARYPPVHEEKKPAYGCLVLSATDVGLLQKEADVEIFHLQTEASLTHLRQLCSGRSTFLIRTFDGPYGLLTLRDADELSLVRRLPKLRAFAVQRHYSGVVALFVRDRLYRHENDEWSVTPYAHTRVGELLALIGRGDAEVGSGLLDTCLHLLSGRHIGSTLVWMLEGDLSSIEDKLSRSGQKLAVSLKIDARGNAEILATLLSAVDGACILDRDGHVMAVEAHLRNTEASVNYVRAEHGTRHTSAKRFSFDEPRAVVFVVSQDGPVTVFSDGLNILKLRGIGTFAASLAANNPNKVKAIKTEVGRVVCGGCGKRFASEVTSFEGWNEAESAPCPVCGQLDIVSDSGVSIRLVPVKPWQ